jgi:hypothetical protein
LWELYKYLDTAADMEMKNLEWTRHLRRRDHERVVNELFESILEGRRTGRSRLRWFEDVEKDLREMKVKRWRQKAVHR